MLKINHVEQVCFIQTKSNTWAANVKNSNVSKTIQANSLLLNFRMKSPCYLVTLSLESSDFQTFLKQYVILVPFGALIEQMVALGSKMALRRGYWFQKRNILNNFIL